MDWVLNILGCGVVAAALIVFYFGWRERHIRRVMKMAKGDKP